MLVLLVVDTLFAAVPARFSNTLPEVIAAGKDQPWWNGGLTNPIGTMIPNKIIALLVMVFAGLISVTSLLRAHSRREIRWGDASKRSQWVLMALGVTVSCMMIVMGIIREHSRQPYLIGGEMTIQGQKVINAPPQVTSPNEVNP
jgi:hypothetical protein